MKPSSTILERGGGGIIKSEKKNPSIVKYFSFLGQSQVVPPVNRR